MKLLSLALISSAVLASSVAFAAPTTGAYLGAGIGINTFNDGDLAKDTAKDVHAKISSSNMAGTIYGGYIFNRVFGLEASYNHYGKIDAKAAGHQFTFMNPTTLSLSANLGFSFKNGLRPFALIGLSSLNVNQGSHVDLLKDDKGAAIHWGAGVDYTMPNIPLTVRAAYQADSFGIETEDGEYDRTMTVGMAYVGAAYHF